MQEFIEGEVAVPPMGEQSIESGGTDNHKADVLARAKEIVSRKPTVAEIEETAARRKRNAAVETMPDLASLQKEWLSGSHMSDERFYEMRRLESLAKMAPPAPSKPATTAPIARKPNENLIERARMSELEVIVKSGGKWSDQERAEWWLLHSMEIGDKADRLVKRNKLSDAIFLVLKEIAINAVGQARAREKLETRVSRLEKPRVRVQAGRQVIA